MYGRGVEGLVDKTGVDFGKSKSIHIRVGHNPQNALGGLL